MDITRESTKLARLLLAAGALALGLAAVPAPAATFTVNSTADTVDAAPGDGVCADVDGACTLRAAIMEADALGGASTIDLTGINDPANPIILHLGGADETWSGQGGKYNVVETPNAAIGDLNITASLTIVGAGADKTVVEWLPSADHDRVFHVQATNADITVAISGLTIQNGYLPPPVDLETTPEGKIWQFRRFGAGIASGSAAAIVLYDPAGHGGGGGEGGGGGGESGFAIESLTLSDVHIVDNQGGSDGGGIYSAAPLTLEHAIVSGNQAGGNGGGIASSAALTMSYTTVGAMASDPDFAVGNSAENGGGIFDSGFHTSSIEKSAITGNMAIGGGGIAGRRLTVIDITDSTVAGNTAQDIGGGISGNGLVVMRNVTVANNVVTSETEGGGAGLNAFGPAPGGGGGPPSNFTFVNTLVANNTLAGTPPVLANCGSTGEGGNNGRYVSYGYNLEDGDTCEMTATGDQINTDPQLEPLADNGGETETLALPQASPAVDTGSNADCTNDDQRDSLRPADGNLDGQFVCDIGAFELYIASADLHINDMIAPNQVFVTDTFHVVVEVHVDPNATAPAEGVELTTDPMPAGVAVSGATVVTPGGTLNCSVGADGAVDCLVGTLNPDETATMDVAAAASVPGAIAITAHVTSTSPPDPDPTNNTHTANIDVFGNSDLSVTASGTADPVDVGSDTEMAFTVANAGPDAATGLRVAAELPDNVTFKSASLSGGACSYESDPNAVVCDVGNLAPGAGLAGTVTVTGAAEGPAATVFLVEADQRDLVPANDSATVTLAIQGLSDLVLSGGFSPTSVKPGGQAALSLHVANYGPSDATNTVVTTPLSAGLTFVAASGGSSCSAAGGTVTCTVGTLADGQSAAVGFTVTVNASAGSTLSATSTVSSDKTDPITGNNSVTSSVSVAPLSSGGGGGGSASPLGLALLGAALAAALALRRRSRGSE